MNKENPQFDLHEFYQELVNENKWETKSYKIALIKGGFRLIQKSNEEHFDFKLSDGYITK